MLPALAIAILPGPGFTAKFTVPVGKLRCLFFEKL
jgi:hypothetical protein